MRDAHPRRVPLTGTAVNEGQPQAWSLVLKVLTPPPDGSRPLEAFLYGSGFLAALSGGLVAPRCLEVDLPGGDVGVWLEHLTETGDPKWTIGRFAVAAKHLGEFAGAQCQGGEIPR